MLLKFPLRYDIIEFIQSKLNWHAHYITGTSCFFIFAFFHGLYLGASLCLFVLATPPGHYQMLGFWLSTVLYLRKWGICGEVCSTFKGLIWLKGLLWRRFCALQRFECSRTTGMFLITHPLLLHVHLIDLLMALVVIFPTLQHAAQEMHYTGNVCSLDYYYHYYFQSMNLQNGISLFSLQHLFVAPIIKGFYGCLCWSVKL